jgi:type IV secretory pathway VirB2 component (pilin)
MAKKLIYLFLEFLILLGALYLVFVWPETCHASVESSLMGIKSKLTGVILPTLSVCGLALAGISFFTGQEKAKQHIIYAVIGCIIGFGAQAIVDFIAQTVN